MAITRTQIAKQLLAQGGRTGFQGGGADLGKASSRDFGFGDRDARDNREIGARMARTMASGQGDAIRKNKEAFETGIGISDLTRLEETGVPKVNFPGALGFGLNALAPLRNFALRKNIERYKRTTTGPYTIEGYKEYMQSMRDRFTSEDNDDSDQLFIPQGVMAQAPSIMDQEPEIKEDDEGLRLAFRAEGGPIGGEYDFDSARQMYGLGKLVKKVTRTVKKIAKSPIGKAALLYTGAAVAGSYGSGQGFFSKGMFNPGNIGRGIFGITAKGQALRGFPELAAQKGLFGKIGFTGGYGSLMPTALGGIAAATALTGLLTPEQEEEAQRISDETGIDIAEIRANPNKYLATRFMAEGGSTEKEPVAKKTMPLLDMDGKEMDLRAEGGFVPIGRMEKADDVPARLSKNEFVFTADAVRNAGEGNVDKGAEVMYNMMKNLEAGGEVSEESQGIDGARRMFQTSQRLEEVL